MKRSTIPFLQASPLVVLMLTFYCASGQSDHQNRITISYGGGTAPEFIGTTEDIIDALFTQGTETINSSASGSIAIQYERQLTDKLSVGISFIYEVISKDIKIDDMQGTTHSEAYEATYPTILLNGSYLYMQKEKLELYARVGVGTCFSKEVTYQGKTTDNSVLFAYQVSPIGIRLGRQVYFNAELGFGYAGIAFIGVGYRF